MAYKNTISYWKPFNVDNKFNVSTATGSFVGEYLSRDKFNEQVNFESVEYHPEYPKFNKRINSYALLKGKIKVTWTFDPEDNITNEDVTLYKQLNSGDPEHESAVIEHDSEKLSFTYQEGYYQHDWSNPSNVYEIATNKSKLEILEEGTQLVCFIFDKGEKWNTKIICLGPNTEGEYINDTMTVANKEGDDCYIYFGGLCEVNGKQIEEFTVKKLTSENITIKNLSEKQIKIFKVFK
jgi:hypothetical protein